MALPRLSIAVFLILCLFLFVGQASSEGWVVYARGTDGPEGLWVMDTNGENQRQLTNIRDGGPVWSPDGRQIAFARLSSDDPDSKGIYVINADGSNLMRLTDGQYDGEPAWSPDGKRIAFSRQVREKEDRDGDGILEIEAISIYIVNLDGTMPWRVTAENPEHWDRYPDWSPDGKKIVFERYNQEGAVKLLQIWVMDSDGSNQEILSNTQDLHQDYQPVWSPDGTKIGFARLNAATKGRDICLMDTNGANVRKLSNSAAINALPKWSPDGTEIVFISNGSGIFKVHTMNADGSNVRQLTHTPAVEYEPDWTFFSYAVEPIRKLRTTWGRLKGSLFCR